MREPIPVYIHLRRAKDLMDREYARELDVRALAREAHASRAHFVRSFKKAFGETPHQYLLQRRIERAKELLRGTGMSVTEVSIEVHQDEALEFYTQKLGFEVNTDATMDDFRWLTVSPPGQPDSELVLLVPGAPMLDEQAAEQVKALVAKGALGAAAFETDDCRGTYDELSARGVTFLSEPTARFYGVEATFRDNSGNWFSMTERTEAALEPEEA